MCVSGSCGVTVARKDKFYRGVWVVLKSWGPPLGAQWSKSQDSFLQISVYFLIFDPPLDVQWLWCRSFGSGRVIERLKRGRECRSICEDHIM